MIISLVRRLRSQRTAQRQRGGDVRVVHVSVCQRGGRHPNAKNVIQIHFPSSSDTEDTSPGRPCSWTHAQVLAWLIGETRAPSVTASLFGSGKTTCLYTTRFSSAISFRISACCLAIDCISISSRSVPGAALSAWAPESVVNSVLWGSASGGSCSDSAGSCSACLSPSSPPLWYLDFRASVKRLLAEVRQARRRASTSAMGATTVPFALPSSAARTACCPSPRTARNIESRMKTAMKR
mmetsp:Transcript_65920/g.196938  ORF Transcript_65920/g.196938 Transcript_65920/m.196938 type:complete len:238 (-) Transcript_65920:547-1260(-)